MTDHPPAPELPPQVAEPLACYVRQLTDTLGDRLVSLVLYGGLARGRYRPGLSDVNFFSVVTAIAAFTMFTRRPIVTAAGRAALRRARAENEALRETASRRTANLSPDDVAMAVGLFGLGAVADPSTHALRRQLKRPANERDGSDSSQRPGHPGRHPRFCRDPCTAEVAV